MSTTSCPQCSTPRSVAKASSCPRCGMPYARNDGLTGSSEGDHYTVVRPAITPERPHIPEQKRPTPASFLAPPPGLDSSRAAPPPQVAQVRQPLPAPIQPRVPESRPAAPARVGAGGRLRSSAPTVLLTILFGMFGAVAAAIQTSSARGRGLETRRYWKAFGITLLFSVLLWVLLLVALFAWLSNQATSL